jgi:hypothetical protein
MPETINEGMEARNRSLPHWFTRIRTGEVKLPRFQRHESWSHNNIANLLESVVQGLPAGAALVLRVGDHEQFVSRPVAGAPELSAQPNEHLLDGQQRLTALWRSFHDKYDDRTYFVRLEAGEDGAEARIQGQPRWTENGTRRPLWADSPGGVHERGLIPLFLLRPGEIGNEVREWCRAAIPDEAEARFDLERQILELRQTVAVYNIPFIELPATTPKDVALDVFIKMNTSFVRLTPFDIIVAQFEEATGESLHALVGQLNERVPTLHLYLEPSDLILDVAALREDRSPTQASYQRLDLQRLLTDWDAVVQAAAYAVDFLEQERIFDGDRLPTVAVVRVLAALSDHVGTAPDDQGNARALLRKYIWRSFLTGRYEAAAATASLQDFRALRDLLNGSTAEVPAFDDAQYPVPTADTLLAARWPAGRDSLGRGILNVTVRAGARDIADDAIATREQLKQREYHHLFPASLLEKEAELSSREIYAALNCALITWRTNRTISAKEPLRYLRDRVEGSDLGEDEIRARLATHYVPFAQLAVGGYDAIADTAARREQLRSDYQAFLRARAEMMLPAVEALCNGLQPPDPRTEPTALFEAAASAE